MKRKNWILVGVFACVVALIVALPKGATGGRPGDGEGDGTEAFRITSVAAKAVDLTDYIETNGDIEADNTVSVYPDISGKLLRMRVELGTAVRKGDLVAEIDPSKPGERYALSPVYAPITGTVTSTPQKAGATVSTGTAIAQIGDIDRLQVVAKVSERNVSVLRKGLRAVVRLEAYPDAEFGATVFRVSPLVDPVSRTKEVFLTFDAADARINSGMFAKVRLFTTLHRDSVTVPEGAVVQNYEKTYVFVVNGDGTVTKREIVRGITVDGVSQVVSGLEAGELVAHQGVTVLSDGVKVRDVGTKEAGR